MPSGNFIRYFDLISPQDTPIEYKYFGQLPGNTWVTIIMYIDYSTGYLYLEVPSMNKTIRSTNPVPLTPNTQGKVLEPIDHIGIGFSSPISDGSINPYFVKDFDLAARNYGLGKVFSVISLLREYDLKSKGVESTGNTEHGDLMRELLWKIIH